MTGMRFVGGLAVAALAVLAAAAVPVSAGGTAPAGVGGTTAVGAVGAAPVLLTGPHGLDMGLSSGTQAQRDPPTSYSLSDVTITLERTACHGTCPQYRVDVSGTVEVARRTRTDGPTRVFTLRLGEYVKTVRDYDGAPGGVSELADSVDVLAETERWVYLGGGRGAAPTGTVIVANMNDNTVWLIDAATGEQRGSIITRAAPHEVAVSGDGRWAAITNYGGQGAVGNLFQIVDIANAVTVRELTVAGYQRLHGAAFLPGDSLLALTSERTGEILIVGADDGVVRRVLPTLGQTPHMLALGGPWIYAANMSSGTVSRLTPGDPAGTTAFPAGIGGGTEGVAATPDGLEVWTASMQTGVVAGVNAETGETVARIDGLQVPYRLAATGDGTRILVSDPEAQQLVVIDRASGSITARIDISAAAAAAGLGSTTSPQGLIVSPDSRWAFVAVQGIQRIAAVDLDLLEVVGFYRAGTAPDGIAFSPRVIQR